MKRLLAISASLLLSGAAFAQAPTPSQTTTGRAGSMSDTQIVQRLEQQGYNSVRVTNHDKGHVDVMASKGGQTQRLPVDPAAGQIMLYTDAD